MVNGDSFDRIVSYFHAMARVEFEYRNKTYTPYDALRISPRAFLDYTCPPSCGACCMTCSLVWDTPPQDDRIPEVEAVEYAITTAAYGRVVSTFFVDDQADNRDHKCRYLYKTHEDPDMIGRCGIYRSRPLPCAFELFKFIHRVDGSRVDARVQLPGRSWALTRVDGNKGGLCELQPHTAAAVENYLTHLRKLSTWMDAFGIQHDALKIINYLETGPHDTALIISRK